MSLKKLCKGLKEICKSFKTLLAINLNEERVV